MPKFQRTLCAGQCFNKEYLIFEVVNVV